MVIRKLATLLYYLHRIQITLDEAGQSKDDIVKQIAQKQREADEAMKDITATMQVCVVCMVYMCTCVAIAIRAL